MRNDLAQQLRNQCINLGYGDAFGMFCYVSDDKFEKIRQTIKTCKASDIIELEGILRSAGLLKVEPHVRTIGNSDVPAFVFRAGYCIHATSDGMFLETSEDYGCWSYTKDDFDYEYSMAKMNDCTPETRSLILFSYLCEELGKFDGIKFTKYASVVDEYLQSVAGDIKLGSLAGKRFGIGTTGLLMELSICADNEIIEHASQGWNPAFLAGFESKTRMLDVDILSYSDDEDGTVGVILKTPGMVAFIPYGHNPALAVPIDSLDFDVIDIMWRRMPYVLLKLAGLSFNEEGKVTSNKMGYPVKEKGHFDGSEDIFIGYHPQGMEDYVEAMYESGEYDKKQQRILGREERIQVSTCSKEEAREALRDYCSKKLV